MSDTILFQDGDAYLSSAVYLNSPLHTPAVTVTRSGLKVGTSIFTFDGVLQVSLRTPLRKPGQFRDPQKPWWVQTYDWVFGGYLILMLAVGSILFAYQAFSGYYGKIGVFLGWLVAGIIVIGLIIRTERAKQKRFHVAELTLERGSETKVVEIGSFRQCPDGHSAQFMFDAGGVAAKDGEDISRRPEVVYGQSVDRVNKITEAVASAILHPSIEALKR